MVHLADSSRLQAFLQAVHCALAAEHSPIVQVSVQSTEIEVQVAVSIPSLIVRKDRFLS